jgi:integrase
MFTPTPTPTPNMKNFKQMVVSAFGPTFQESTRERYGDLIEKWIEYTKMPLDILIRDPEEAMKLLETFPIKHTPENHHTYLTPIVAYLHHVLRDPVLEEKWTTLKRINWEPIQQRYDENRPSEHQQDKIMEFEEIERIRQTLERGSIERLLLSFYTLVEANRADYFATELIQTGQESTEENYIIDHTTLIIRDFKTKATYKKIENTLSEEVQEELRESLKKKPRRYLFTREDNTPYPNRKQFSNWACRTLTTALKHPMTLTALRHLYIGHHIQNKTPKELTEMAKKMGHTRSMQRAYEWTNQTEQP